MTQTTTDHLSALQGHARPDTSTGGAAARIWQAAVIAVNPDGTVDLDPILGRAVKVGVPAPDSYTPAVGDQVLVADLNGDPRTPQVLSSLTSGTAPAGPAGGDLAGSYPNPTVAQASQASLTFASNQSIPSGASTALVWDTPAQWAIGGVTANAGGINVTKAGLYLVTCTVRWTEASTVGYRQLIVTGLGGGNSDMRADNGGGIVMNTVSCQYRLAANTTVQAFAFQNSGGALSIFGAATWGNQLAVTFLSH